MGVVSITQAKRVSGCLLSAFVCWYVSTSIVSKRFGHSVAVVGELWFERAFESPNTQIRGPNNVPCFLGTVDTSTCDVRTKHTGYGSRILIVLSRGAWTYHVGRSADTGTGVCVVGSAIVLFRRLEKYRPRPAARRRFGVPNISFVLELYSS